MSVGSVGVWLGGDTSGRLGSSSGAAVTSGILSLGVLVSTGGGYRDGLAISVPGDSHLAFTNRWLST